MAHTQVWRSGEAVFLCNQHSVCRPRLALHPSPRHPEGLRTKALDCVESYTARRYWTPEPKEDKIETLAVPVALMQALQFHGSSLALSSLVFSLLVPLRVRPLAPEPTFLHNSPLHSSARQLCILCTASSDVAVAVMSLERPANS